MTKHQFDNEKDYGIALAIAKNMLESQSINDKEFKYLKKLLIKKYRPLIGRLG
jgi:hypothetical protein